MSVRQLAVVPLVVLASLAPAAEVCNVHLCTDANPDYTDMADLVRSVTSRWEKPADKVWAMFYWTHIGRRQTPPMIVHGIECADPIRQFNDYGFTMCSTVSGVNCAIWHHMGLPSKFWDISCHTVAECFYDDRWHVYDNAFSAMYTLCDGKTIAGVMDVAAEGACALSGGKREAGHIAKYHCLTATSPNGFITGSDGDRTLSAMHGAFTGHQYRYYYSGWDDGHRYRLDLKDGASYTRFYHSLGDAPKFFVPNVGEHPEKPSFDPESPNRFGVRGNGVWTWAPPLDAAWAKTAHVSENIALAGNAGLSPAKAGAAASVAWKVDTANVATAETITAAFARRGADDQAAISISTDNGLDWKQVWKADGAGDAQAKVDLVAEVNGAYEILVRVDMQAARAPRDVALKSLAIETTTEINAKANPRLNLGKNRVYLGADDQTESIVVWPDPEGVEYRRFLKDESNVACAFDPNWVYYGHLHPKDDKQEAWLVYELSAPRDIVRLTYGGRFSNRYEKEHIDLLYSIDGGKTWTTSWSLTSAEQPWDTLHEETVAIPAGHRSVLVKYLMSAKASIYALHMAADYTPADATFRPIEATWTWKEVQPDRSLVQRSHTEVIAKLPTTYQIDVGGIDQPVMESLRLRLVGAGADAAPKPGYSDGKDAGGEKYVYRWRTEGTNWAVGKPYTIDGPVKEKHPHQDTVLTDGVAGPPVAGGLSPTWGVQFNEGAVADITVDLGEARPCGAFTVFITAGYPWWDALKGEVRDQVELLTSDDGTTFTSRGSFPMGVLRKDVPINHMLQDDETARGWDFELTLEKPVPARYVRWHLQAKRWLSVCEVRALDAIAYQRFDIRIALPGEK